MVTAPPTASLVPGASSHDFRQFVRLSDAAAARTAGNYCADGTRPLTSHAGLGSIPSPRLAGNRFHDTAPGRRARTDEGRRMIPPPFAIAGDPLSPPRQQDRHLWLFFAPRPSRNLMASGQGCVRCTGPLAMSTVVWPSRLTTSGIGALRDQVLQHLDVAAGRGVVQGSSCPRGRGRSRRRRRPRPGTSRPPAAPGREAMRVAGEALAVAHAGRGEQRRDAGAAHRHRRHARHVDDHALAGVAELAALGRLEPSE